VSELIPTHALTSALPVQKKVLGYIVFVGSASVYHLVCVSKCKYGSRGTRASIVNLRGSEASWDDNTNIPAGRVEIRESWISEGKPLQASVTCSVSEPWFEPGTAGIPDWNPIYSFQNSLLLFPLGSSGIQDLQRTHVACRHKLYLSNRVSIICAAVMHKDAARVYDVQVGLLSRLHGYEVQDWELCRAL
jgi:hypothetical protein